MPIDERQIMDVRAAGFLRDGRYDDALREIAAGSGDLTIMAAIAQARALERIAEQLDVFVSRFKFE